MIPTLPAVAILRRLAAGELQPGAMPCVGLITLDAIEAEFSSYRIATRIDVEPSDLFARAVPGFERMPAAIKAGHLIRAGHTLRGEARVDGAETRAGTFLAALFGLPTLAETVPVVVRMEPDGNGEVWTRYFGPNQLRSVLRQGGRGHITERFGLLTFDLDVTASERGLSMSIRGCRLGPIRFPAALSPATEAKEELDENGRFRFDVTITLPWIGRLARYRGWLVPDPEELARTAG